MTEQHMRMRAGRWVVMVAALLLVPLLPAGAARADGWTDDTLRSVAPDPIGGLSGAAMDDNWLVWSQDQAPDDQMADERDVYALDLNTNQVTTVAAGANHQGAFTGIDDGVVIWTEADCYSCFTERISGMDLATGRSFVIADINHPSELGAPVVAWNWVVWSERTAEGEDLLLARDIETMGDPVVITRGFVSVDGSESPIRPFWHVAAWQNWVVWQERTAPDLQPMRLMARNLFTGETKTLAETFPRAFDVSGAMVTAIVPAAASGQGHDAIVVVDILTGAQSTVPIPTEAGPAGSDAIETDGSTVIWQLPSGNTAGLVLASRQPFQLAASWDRVELDQGRVSWFISRAWDGPTEIHSAPVEAFTSGIESRYFSQTDQWLSTGFLHYWQGNGGLVVFGYPLTAQTYSWASANRPPGVQWLERQRFEWHPDNAGTAYDVLLGRLGAELLEQQGRDWTTFELADPSAPHYMEVTGHAIAPAFWEYWSGHGLDLGDPGVSFRESLALFGYPLSEPMMETNADGDTVLTQYFERAVFEHHPDNPAPYQVLLRRLGVELRPVGEEATS